jgi:uncharacterized protein
MGWRGSGGNGASDIGVYFFFGGLLMILGSVGEVSIATRACTRKVLIDNQWIVGNTFPFVVFGTFGAFWLSWAATLQPFYNTYGAYSTTSNPAEGLKEPMFYASFGILRSTTVSNFPY